MRILQITDIHIGGEYNGKFQCKRNFERVISNALEQYQDIELIVITGDLADSNYLENYAYIKAVLDRTGVRYMVIPGNHDNRNDMAYIFGVSTINLISGYRSENGILFWDNCIQYDGKHPEFPKVQGIRTVFCHYPVGHIPHRFMEKHAIPQEQTMQILKDMRSTGVENVFCGHFHFLYYPSLTNAVWVHVTPATQCQLNPANTECDPNDLRPGYAVITTMDNGAVLSYVPIMLED